METLDRAELAKEVAGILPKGMPAMKVVLTVPSTSLVRPNAHTMVSYQPEIPAALKDASEAEQTDYFKMNYGPGIDEGYICALIGLALDEYEPLVTAEKAQNKRPRVALHGFTLTVSAGPFVPESGTFPDVTVEVVPEAEGAEIPAQVVEICLFTLYERLIEQLEEDISLNELARSIFGASLRN